jgi:hypothetical protein
MDVLDRRERKAQQKEPPRSNPIAYSRMKTSWSRMSNWAWFFVESSFLCHTGLSGWAKANKMVFGFRLYANSTAVKGTYFDICVEGCEMVGDRIIHVAKRGWKEAESAAQPQNWGRFIHINHRLSITCLVAFLDEQCPEGSVEQLGDISRSLASREGHP